MIEFIVVVLCAFIADCIIGDPSYRLHPVRIIGDIIKFQEKMLFKLNVTGIAGGFLLLILTTLITLFIFLSIHFLLYMIYPTLSLAWDIFMLYSSIALHDMIKHTKPIIEALRNNNLTSARKLVQAIVGRDTEQLNAEGIARATVESVAEGFVDGFFSPLFWFTIAGITAHLININNIVTIAVTVALIYRSVNTLDSMVGYRNKRYIKFGAASAVTDDILNFIPARLSMLILVPASVLCKLDFKQGWKTALRDRLKHASPNSGHTESFVAGALGIKLGGPTIYKYGTVEKPWLGDGSKTIESRDVIKTCKLVTCAGYIVIITICVIGGILS